MISMIFCDDFLKDDPNDYLMEGEDFLKDDPNDYLMEDKYLINLDEERLGLAPREVSQIKTSSLVKGLSPRKVSKVKSASLVKGLSPRKVSKVKSASLVKGSFDKKVKKKTKKEHTKYFENGTRQDWHHHKVFQEHVLKFSENFAKQPDMKEANEMHTKIMKKVEESLKEVKIFSRLEFAGSAYEGVKVTDLEFDVMVIMKVPSLAKEQIEGKPNFAFLKPENDAKQQLAEFLDSNGYISSSKVTDFFFKHLQICCNNFVEKTLLRKHGPAIQMDVYEGKDQFFYSVDIVPTVTVQGELYVAKQLKTVQSYKMDLTWRKTFSLSEKDLLSNIDLNNGCRKRVLRIVKAIRNAEPSLHKVTSYVLKNVVLRVHDKLEPRTLRPGKTDPWNVANIGSRLMDVIRQLKEEFNAGIVPCYFDHRINLIEDFKPITISNIRDRFRHLLNSYKQMKDVLKVNKRTV